MAGLKRTSGVARGRRWALVVALGMLATSLSVVEAEAQTTSDAGSPAPPALSSPEPVAWSDRDLGSAPERPEAPATEVAGPAGPAEGRFSPDAQVSAIDTSSREAVLAAYNAEFNRTEPASGWNGSGPANCVVGSTSAAYKQSVIQRINWYRAMAGMDPVVLDNTMSNQAQFAALIMAAEGSLSHNPPASWACWTQTGANAAGASNLALGGSGITAIDWYMEDFGDNNAAVGHRWWLMQPWAVRMGTGDVPGTASLRPANAVYVVDQDNYAPGTGQIPDPDRVWSWPPAGYVPENTVWPRWSAHLDSASLGWGMSSATVQVSVDGTNVPVTIEYRDADTITFVPATTGSGDRDVTVTVTGIQTDEGPISKSWTTSIIGASEYVPITPCRVLDTRGWDSLFGPGSEGSLRVAGGGPEFAENGGRAGGCGIPMSASAVEASITAVDPWRGGYLRAWPSDEPQPNATFLNFTAGKSTTNTGAVPLAGGYMDLGTPSGITDVVVDVQGYFTATSPGARYTPITPCRVVDSRSGGGAFAPGTQRSVRVTGSGTQFAAQGGRPGGCGIATGARAIEATITAVTPTGANGYTRAWPAGSGVPNATFLNYVRGEGISNTGAVPLATAGTSHLSLRNYSGRSHYVVDVQGFFSDGTGARYVPITPCRVIDTRSGAGAFVSGTQRAYRVAGSGPQFASQGGRVGGCGVPPGALAVEASVSAVGPRGAAAGYLRAWPAGQGVPNATFLNYTRGQSTTNTGAVPLATTGTAHLNLRNYAGTTDVVVDVQGYFVAP